MTDRFDDDLEIIEDTTVFEDVVFEDDESVREYLKTEWLESLLAQMVNQRVSAGVSQKKLGEKIGKSQPAIARLEQGSDLKLSTLWDYYVGLGFTPRLELDLELFDEVETRLRKFYSRTPTPKSIYRAKHWLDARFSISTMHDSHDSYVPQNAAADRQTDPEGEQSTSAA